MRRVLPLTVLLTFFISIISFSQIIIKEKIKIVPGNNMQPSNITAHSLRFILSWTPSTATEGRITVVTYCGDTLRSVWTNTGNSSIIIGEARGYRYYFLFEGRRYYEGEWHYLGTLLQNPAGGIYIDDQPYPLGESQIGGYVTFAYNFGAKIYSDYLCYPVESKINMPNFTTCNSISLLGSDIVTYRIVSGATYISFYDKNSDQLLGDDIQFRLDESSNILLKQDKISQDSTIIVKIEGSVLNYYDSDTAIIIPNKFQINAEFASNDSCIVFYGSSEKINMLITSMYGYLAPDIIWSASIIKGSEYGKLVDIESGLSGDTIIVTRSTVNRGYIEFDADEKNPEEQDSVIIQFSTSEPAIKPKNFKFIIRPSQLDVNIIPMIVPPGDTAEVVIKKKNPDGTLEDFPSEQTFEIGILDGCEGGDILSDDSLGVYFYDVPQPIKFVATDSLQNDSLRVKLMVGLIKRDTVSENITQVNNKQNTSGNIKAQKKQRQKQFRQLSTLTKYKEELTEKSTLRTEPIPKEKIAASNYCFGGDFITKDKVPSQAIIKKEYEILLGETKYFQARYTDTLSNKLVIEEIKPGSDGVPKLNGGIASDVWGNNPVIVDTGKNYGKRMGIYWETEKPVWVDTIKKGNLATGLIRFIGKYWSKDSIYVVTIKAKNNEDSSSIKIKVVKPKKLGDKHPEEKDVLGNTFNVDSLCIYNSGEIGLSPQIIKGHMEKETAFQNSFRYEPRRDIVVQNNAYKKKKYLDQYLYYTVTESNMGTIAMPNNHKNVKPVSYITSPIKIGEYLAQKISNYIRYPKKDKNGKWLAPFFIGYQKGAPSKKLQNEYNKMKDSLDLKDAMQYAIDSLKKWLKTDTFKDGKKYAQSRIFSSYGMLQQVFYFACTDKIAGYAISNDKLSPESLNEIKNSVKAYKVKILKNIKNKFGGQLHDGYEGYWMKVLQSYNSLEKDYGKIVMGLSKQYLPK